MLKIIAFICMFADHLGQVYYPNNVILRIIGRIAFPLFAWGIAVGMKNTRNWKLYAFRVFILAVISEIPHLLLFRTDYINVCFTLLVGILIIKLCEIKPLYYSPIIILLLIVTEILYFEYGLYGILTIVIFYFFEKVPLILALQTIATVAAIYYYSYDIIQLYSILAVLVILLLRKYDFKINRIIQYSFYPAHMIILLILTHIFL